MNSNPNDLKAAMDAAMIEYMKHLGMEGERVFGLENTGNIREVFIKNLDELIETKSKVIVKEDPSFFSRYNIDIPKSVSTYIFEKVYDIKSIPQEYKRGAINDVTTRLKTYFSEITSIFRSEDIQRIKCAVKSFKDALNCKGLESYMRS
jgi:hypothetical protein